MKTICLPLCSAIFFLVVTACSNTPDTPAKHKEVKTEKPSVQLTLLPQDAISPGKPARVMAKLIDLKTRSIITDDQLNIVHTKKFHLLVIDPTLTDYQHIHPQPTETPGVYSFTFTPKLSGGYRAWADITPAATGKQLFASADLANPRGGNINKAETNQATLDGYTFTLSFDAPPSVGNASMGTIHITNKKGTPVTSLQPVMGAFAHVVSFSEDFRSVIHTHPMGKEPESNTERGGPDLMFHLEPKKAGFIKLFAQVMIDNKELFVPFGINVKP